MSTLMRWQNCAPAETIGLSYPRRNVFIPSESGIRVKKKPNQSVPKTFEEKIKPITPPSIIRDDGDEGRWTVWYKQDDRFGKPKAFMIFQLLTDELYSSPTKASLASLYQQCAADKLNEYTYDARLADLSYDFQVLPRGVRLTFGGYNDKLKTFASYVITVGKGGRFSFFSGVWKSSGSLITVARPNSPSFRLRATAIQVNLALGQAI